MPGRELRDEARELLEEALSEIDYRMPASDFEPVLCTRFDRVTLVARDEPERLTIDLDLTLEAIDGKTARMREGRALVETKTRDGSGVCDRVLEEMGVREISLSKYRIGIGLLVRPGEDAEYVRERAQLFEIG